MPITDLLERNSKLYGEEIALVEINPEIQEAQRVTWKEYELIQPTSSVPYRRAITWSVFDEKANRVANMLLGRGIRKGQKVELCGGTQVLKEPAALLQISQLQDRLVQGGAALPALCLCHNISSLPARRRSGPIRIAIYYNTLKR